MILLIILIITCLLIVYHSSTYLERFVNNKETIFVSVPSYRDTDCHNTLTSLFDNAKYPELIYVGVFQQIDTNNKDEFCKVNIKYIKQVRYNTVHYKDAKGPLYARSMINKYLYGGEKYYLMIDAHTLFLENWDIRMKNQLSFLRDQGVLKPIISSYPHHIDLTKGLTIPNKKRHVTTLICDILNAKKYPTETLALEKPSGKFYKSLLLGAGYLFTYGNFFKEIHLDINLKHIFSGEEILLAILAYTHGWDIFSPAYMNLFHYYNHNKPNWHRDVFKQDPSSKLEERHSYNELEKIMTCKSNIKGLGNIRNINNFWKELGFNSNGNTLKDKYPEKSKHLRCNKTPVIIYPYIESFINNN